jgi:hypothetical protein
VYCRKIEEICGVYIRTEVGFLIKLQWADEVYILGSGGYCVYAIESLDFSPNTGIRIANPSTRAEMCVVNVKKFITHFFFSRILYTQ